MHCPPRSDPAESHEFRLKALPLSALSAGFRWADAAVIKEAVKSGYVVNIELHGHCNIVILREFPAVGAHPYFQIGRK